MATNLEKIENLIEGSRLREIYNTADAIAGRAYYLNRESLKAFDINDDDSSGQKLGSDLVKKIDLWIRALENVKNEAKKLISSCRGAGIR